jgi:hypothetical protein
VETHIKAAIEYEQMAVILCPFRQSTRPNEIPHARELKTWMLGSTLVEVSTE